MRKSNLAIILLLVLVACGPSQREQTIKITLTRVNQARDAFIVLDQKIQAAIVDSAKTFEEGVARLEAYRQKRALAVQGFEIAYRMIAIAATSDDDKSLLTMLATMREIISAVETLSAYPPE